MSNKVDIFENERPLMHWFGEFVRLNKIKDELNLDDPLERAASRMLEAKQGKVLEYMQNEDKKLRIKKMGLKIVN